MHMKLIAHMSFLVSILVNTPLFGACAHELSVAQKSTEKVQGSSISLEDLLDFIGRGYSLEDIDTFKKNLDHFLKGGGSIDEEFSGIGTMLYYAAHCGNSNLPVIQHLLVRGANIEWKDRKGRTPLVMALRNHQLKAFRCLLEGGANCDEPKIFGRNASYKIAEFWQPERIKIDESNLQKVYAELLLEEGVKIEPNLEEAYHDSIRYLVKKEMARREGFDPLQYHKELTNNIYDIVGNEKHVSLLIADYAKSSRTIRLEKLLAQKKY